MARRTTSKTLVIRSIPSRTTTAANTPVSSANPSTYPSEVEDDEGTPKKRPKAFAFLALPSELRNRIYSLAFNAAPAVIDLDPSVFSTLHRNKILALFSVNRQVHLEATHRFFSTHTFRLFPTYPGRYFKTKRPLLARLPKHYRSSITSLELRLGPGWSDPPAGWVVNEKLGLKECVNVRVIKVFVECDPSDGIFKGWRAADGFYEKFSQKLLKQVLTEVPSVTTVEFDAYPSVLRSGDMMQGLGMVVSDYKKILGWGPERGWDQESDNKWLNALLANDGTKLCKSIAIFA